MTDPIVVARIVDIQPHPNADRVELTRVMWPRKEDGAECDVVLVTGKHYQVGDCGLWIPPGHVIPGWLSYQLWMHGKSKIPKTFEVRLIPLRGVDSPGLWAGEFWRNDKAVPAVLDAEAREHGADFVLDGWLHWGIFQPEWRPGDIITVNELERLHSSTAEQPVYNRKVGGQVGRNAEALGSIPPAGSTSSAAGDPVAGGVHVES